jgi:hypothetical protein
MRSVLSFKLFEILKIFRYLDDDHDTAPMTSFKSVSRTTLEQKSTSPI